MILDFLCKHSFKKVRELPVTFKFDDDSRITVPISLYECEKCHKRKILREADCFYKEGLLKKLELWYKHEIDLEEI